MLTDLEKKAELDKAQADAVKVKALDGLRRRLMEVTGRLILQVHTPIRVVLEKYYPHMRLSAAFNDDSSFPQSLCRQIRNPEATSKDGTKGDLLCFHVGNAIMAYYDLDVDVMEKRVALLEAIEARGYAKAIRDGAVSCGFYLTAAPEEKKRAAAKPQN